MFHLDVTAVDVDAFVTSPAHETRADGYIDSPLYGGRRPVSNGTVNLFVNQADPTKKNMFYRLFFTAADGRQLTLTGFKDIEGPSATLLWNETTTLYTQILVGPRRCRTGRDRGRLRRPRHSPGRFFLQAVVLLPDQGSVHRGAPRRNEPVRSYVLRQGLGRLRSPGGTRVIQCTGRRLIPRRVDCHRS